MTSITLLSVAIYLLIIALLISVVNMFTDKNSIILKKKKLEVEQKQKLKQEYNKGFITALKQIALVNAEFVLKEDPKCFEDLNKILLERNGIQ